MSETPNLDAFKKQYTLKQSFYFYLGSKLNLIVLTLCYIFGANFGEFIIYYFFAVLFTYKVFYNKTKSDNPYLELVFEKYSKLIKFARTNRWNLKF